MVLMDSGVRIACSPDAARAQWHRAAISAFRTCCRGSPQTRQFRRLLAQTGMQARHCGYVKTMVDPRVMRHARSRWPREA